MEAVATTKKNYRKPGSALLVWGVPEEVKAAFKATCRRRGISMQDAVRHLLEKYTEQNKERV